MHRIYKEGTHYTSQSDEFHSPQNQFERMHKIIKHILYYEFNLLAYLGLPLTAGFSWH